METHPKVKKKKDIALEKLSTMPKYEFSGNVKKAKKGGGVNKADSKMTVFACNIVKNMELAVHVVSLIKSNCFKTSFLCYGSLLLLFRILGLHYIFVGKKS